MSLWKLPLSPASDPLSTASLFKISQACVTRGVQLGFVTILLFMLPCIVRRVQVKDMATVPSQPTPWKIQTNSTF